MSLLINISRIAAMHSRLFCHFHAIRYTDTSTIIAKSINSIPEITRKKVRASQDILSPLKVVDSRIEPKEVNSSTNHFLLANFG